MHAHTPEVATPLAARIENVVEAQMLNDEAGNYDALIEHQERMANSYGDPWIADRYARAMKANRSLATALRAKAQKVIGGR
jgi:hypothetical protein